MELNSHSHSILYVSLLCFIKYKSLKTVRKVVQERESKRGGVAWVAEACLLLLGICPWTWALPVATYHVTAFSHHNCEPWFMSFCELFHIHLLVEDSLYHVGLYVATD